MILRNTKFRRSAVVALCHIATISSNYSMTAVVGLSTPSKTHLAASLSSTDATSSSSSILSSIKLDNTWPRQLSPETKENLVKSRKIEGLSENDKNKKKRPVFNGHYVLVEPSGLQECELILVSDDVAYNLLKLSNEQVQSQDFVDWVCGNLILEETWATPYALSIMGNRYTSNCPYGTGNGYGDGRAISIAEFNGYELQLKGAGTTPFHRGADGRAVLRSSIREFLASEAMHHLNIETTRALSLVKSNKDISLRPWYSENSILEIPDINDPRLLNYPEEKRKQIIDQLRRTRKADPNTMIQEPCAITCRVAPSFTRIGHIDLFARRAQKASIENDKVFDTTTNEWKELEEIIWHGCYREYKKEAFDPYIEDKDIASAGTKMLELAADRISTMVTNWLRVGFAQGNFNADNCLISGKTMDYGPFGFMEEFDPLFAKWTGSGDHFGFMNQPSAGLVNYQVLVESVVPVICAGKGLDDPQPVIEEFMQKAQETFQNKIDELYRIKMGFPKDADAADELWGKLMGMMQQSRVDWTVFWRQLSYVMRDFPDVANEDYEDMMKTLESQGDTSPFYEPLTPSVRREWVAWIKDWREIHKFSQVEDAASKMLSVNPKFVLREWMLVDAYTAAGGGDYTILKELYELIQHPYAEGTAKESAEYYRHAPERALVTGGTAFMT